MTGLDRLNKQIYDTYHDPKNKEVLPIYIFFGVICLLFNGAMIFELIIWGIYYLYCSSNNQKLNNDPQNLKRRKFLLEFREKILSGELKFNEDE